MSKARDLANFISNPTVEATEIANGAITSDKIANTAVTADKLHTTLDLSSKTLTFATNHLSGDNIHGGVISDFESTGIDDNATNTAITIATNKDVTFTNNVAAAYFSGDGSQLTGLPPGYTNSDVAAYLANNDYDTATNIIAEISNSAPTTLNTLNELAAALGDDANFSTTVTDALGNRLRIDTAAQSLTSTQKTNALTNLGITATVAELNKLDGVTATTAELNYVDGVTSNIQTQLNAKAASTDLTDGTITKINSQATVGDSIEFFQNDGGGNLGIRFNANYNSGDFSVEDGSAWEFQFDNDSTSGDFRIYYDGSISSAGEAISWVEALRLDGGDSSLYIFGDKVFIQGQDLTENLTINKGSAKISFKDTASGGPHGLDFYDTDGTLKWSHYYRTTPDTLTWEPNGSSEVLSLDTSGNLTLSGNSADLNLRTGASGQTAFINWQFNTTSTNYIQMGIDYDTRSSTGWFIDSGYPITIDYTTSLQFKASGTNTISMDSGGNLSNVGIITAARARLTGTGDVTLSSTNHAFQIGASTAVNIAIDANEIQARNNGAASTLHLNLDGGGTSVGGALDVTGGITSDGVLRGTTTTGAGTPTFSFDGDTNTGMYHVTTDTIGFTTGGTERARINSSGLQLAHGKLVRFDNTSDSNYDVTLGSYYDFDAWFQIKSGEGTTRFSVGRDNNAYLGGAGSAGNRVLTQADEGSGNGLDADTVDGLQASQFLRADASDTTTGSLTINGDIIVDEIRARSSQDLCITAGESRNHLTDGTYNDEYIRLAAESGVIAYASSDNLTSGLNRSITLINSAGHTITGGTLNCGAGLIVGRVSTTANFINANDTGSMSVRGNSSKPAVMSFHRAGVYAMNFGLDTDSHLKVGGWSAGNNTPHVWQNNGNYLATGNITAYSSDKRLKINVVNIPNALNKVMSLNGVTFDWKEKVQELGFEPTRMTDEIGVLAQEVEAVIPQATAPAPFDLKNDNGKTVSKSGENYLTVQYEKIVPLLIEAIKEQQAQIEELKKKIQE